MRYFTRGNHTPVGEVDLVLNAPDSPSCPRCNHYNAMLSEYAANSEELLKCRDCGFAVEGFEEIDTQSAMQAMVENASDDALCAGVKFLRSVYGSSCSTAAEFVRMLDDTTYAREALYNTSYHLALDGFYAGYREAGARSSAALLITQTTRHITDPDKPNSDFGANKGTY